MKPELFTRCVLSSHLCCTRLAFGTSQKTQFTICSNDSLTLIGRIIFPTPDPYTDRVIVRVQSNACVSKKGFCRHTSSGLMLFSSNVPWSSCRSNSGPRAYLDHQQCKIHNSQLDASISPVPQGCRRIDASRWPNHLSSIRCSSAGIDARKFNSLWAASLRYSSRIGLHVNT